MRTKTNITTYYTILVLLLTFMVSAQDRTDRDAFKIGINGALPLGDAQNIAKFSLGVDVAYHYGISKVFDIGLATGFTNAFGETISEGPITEFPNVQFVPVAGLLRIYPHVRSRLNFGVDFGYAMGIDEGNEGGLYYRPVAAFNLNRGTEVTASYTGISLENGSWETATLGLVFSF